MSAGLKLELTAAGLSAVLLQWDDAGALQSLLEACGGYFTQAEGRSVGKGEGLERISEALGDEAQRLWGVRLREAGDLVAMLDLRLHTPEPNRATIALLLVHPQHRRHGHAAALVAGLLEALREAAFESIHLGVRSGARGAMEFWPAQGFEELSRGGGVTEYVLQVE